MRGSLESIIKHMIKLNNHKSNISFPAIVVNTDNLADGFIDVKPLVNNMNSVTGETIEYPPIRNVQVLMPSTMSSSIVFPVKQGDTVDLLFQSVDIVDFVNGEKEAHDPFGNGWGNLANVVAIIGFNPYQESPFNSNNYSNDFDNQDLNIVHNKNTGLESSVNISASGSILQKAPNAVTVDSPLFDVKSDLLNANNAIITTGGDVVVRGQSLNEFMLKAPIDLKGGDGDKGWSPVFSVEDRNPDESVLKITDWVGGEGDKPSEVGYIGSNGLVEDILDAINIKGARGSTGSSGASLSADVIQDIVNDQFTVGAILDLIQGQIDESALTAALTSKIAVIEVNKMDIAREARERVVAISETAKQIEAEAAARVEDIRLAAESQKELQDFADRLSDDVDTVVVSQTKTDEGIAVIKERQTTFEIENGLQAEKLTYLSSQIDFEYADSSKYADKSKATVWTFAKAVAHADYTNAQMITGLSADYKDSSARFTENIELLSKKNEATATKTTTLSAQVLGNYTGGGLGKLNSGLLFEESKARATDVEGLAEQISLLSAGVGEQFDSFEIWHFNKDKDGWTGGTFSGGWIDVKTETLQSPEILDLDGAVYKHVKLRIKKVGQPTWSGLLTHVGGSKTIKEPSYDEEGVALANWQLEWVGDITSFTLKLASVADDTNYYSIDWIAVGRPSPGASNAAILRESKVRASETSANASDLVKLNSQINGGTGVPIESSITKKLDTTANVAKTTADKVDVLTSKYNTDMYTYEGVVQTTARTLAEATKAEAERLDLLSADVKPRYADASRYVNINRATQWTYWKTIAADNYNSNQRVSELKSEFLDSNANLTSELFTLAQADKAISSSISQLSAKTDSNEALIQDLQYTITTPSTGLAAKVTELQASTSTNSKDIETVGKAAKAAAELAGNKGEVIYSSTEPATDKRKVQNLWIDTSGGKNTPKRWAGSSWLTVTDKAATDAQAAADKANNQLLPANIATLVEGSGAFSGDFGAISGKFATMQGVVDGQKTAIETVSAVGNVEKLKNEIAKARLDKDLTNLNAQVTALDNAIISYDKRVVELTAKRNADKPPEMSQEAYVALKASYQSQIDELTLAKADAVAQKAVIADNAKQLADEKKVLDSLVITEKDVKAQHTIKIDAGGKIAGYGLVVQKDNYSAFDIRADRFTISPPVGKPNDVSGSSPFMVITTPTTINGIFVDSGVYMRKAYIARASIDRAHIKDLAVDTLQIENNAVTVPVAAETTSDITVVSTDGYKLIQEIPCPTSMGTTSVSINFSISGTAVSSGIVATLKMEVNDVMVKEQIVYSLGNLSSSVVTLGSTVLFTRQLKYSVDTNVKFYLKVRAGTSGSNFASATIGSIYAQSLTTRR